MIRALVFKLSIWHVIGRMNWTRIRTGTDLEVDPVGPELGC